MADTCVASVRVVAALWLIIKFSAEYPSVRLVLPFVLFAPRVFSVPSNVSFHVLLLTLLSPTTPKDDLLVPLADVKSTEDRFKLKAGRTEPNPMLTKLPFEWTEPSLNT